MPSPAFSAKDPDEPNRLLIKSRLAGEIWTCDKGWKGIVPQERARGSALEIQG